jgi:hypothetical protein
MIKLKQKASELIKKINDKIQQKNEYLRQLRIDEDVTIACNQLMNELKKEIETERERRNSKKSMFCNQTMKFEENNTQIGEKFLGKLILSFHFSVIITILLIFLN